MASLRRVCRGILDMCEPAWLFFRSSLIMSCIMLGCSLTMLLYIGNVTTDTYNSYLTAIELAKAPASLLLVAAIGTVCLEERLADRSGN